MKDALLETRIDDVPLFRRGKVRDIYDLGEQLLMVATDRISAYDVIMPNGIPGKGIVLTQMSLLWFEQLKDVVKNHLVSAQVSDYPKMLTPHYDTLHRRSMLVWKMEPVEVECVVRGYLAGSGWKDYQKTGAVCGIALSGGLREGERLEEPLFTPATKAHTGHDENISFSEVERLLGAELAERLRSLSIEIYRHAADYASSRGFILVDTKFEFGMRDGELFLIDEALTPDSSRFWRAEEYRPGAALPQSFDKQYVRNYLDSIAFNRKPPAPMLSDEVVKNTQRLYLDAYEQLAGEPLSL
ncbi:MAG: phosphoribosylaminoimidazolesuccinocarboxamide synthase [Acidobacteriota bacterium]|nr:MAG: phosphoribosylaminoimidazolesuccinocarboxamide synthase [Acidobacteriota bacterium]